MIKKLFGPAVIATVVCYSPLAAWGDYILVLKNGRRITVHSYRESGSNIQVNGLGGEIGFPKDQIQTILKAGETRRPDLNLSDLDRSAPPASSRSAHESSGRPFGMSIPPRTPEVNESASADEDSSDQKRLAEIDEKLNAAKTRYLTANQGGGAASSATKDGYRALTADLMSRLKSRRGAADSEYEPQEKELRDLRLEIEKLQSERDDLVSRIRSKNSGKDLP